MTLGNTPAPDARLVDVTFFAATGYFDCEEATRLDLPVLSLSGFIPGRYL